MNNQYWQEEIETLHPEQTRNRQFCDLQKMVQFVCQNSPFYRKHYAGLELENGTIDSWDKFQILPTICKADIRNDMKDHPIYGSMLALPEAEIVYISSSSGTTNRPTISPFSQADFDDIVSISSRFFYGQGLRKSDRYMHCLNLSMFVASPAVLSAQEIGAGTIWAGILPVEVLARYIHELGITAILTTPSFAERLGVYMQNQYPSENSNMKTIIVAGEPGGSISSTRDALRHVWGDINIGEVYGFSEIMGCIAGMCPAQEGLHVAEDRFVIELLHPHRDDPVEEGQLGEITITALHKRARPMIRYRSGDCGTIKRCRCACGRTHARVFVRGRLDDMFIVSGVNVFPTDVEQAIHQCRDINNEYRIILNDEHYSTSYDIEVERKPECTTTTGDICSQLSQMLKQSVFARPRKIVVVNAGDLPRAEFKARRLVDNRSSKIGQNFCRNIE